MCRFPIVIAGVRTPELVESSFKAFGREQILGFVDDDFQTLPKAMFGLPVLGPWNWIVDKKIRVINSVAKDSMRRKIAFEKLLGYGAIFAEFPHLDLSEREIGVGSAILDHAFLSTNIKVEKNVFLHNYSYVGHDCIIGSHSIVSVGATLLGKVKVSQECFIGARSTIIQGVSIGTNSVIASGSVVYSDVPANHLSIGNPATSHERSDIVK